jgi:hypothetical protein
VNLQPEVDDSTFGVLHLLRNIQQSRLMIVASKDQYILALGNTFGRVRFQVNVASSCGWFVVHNKCWTVDWGLQHPPRCPLCDQESEIVNHLLVACIFSWQFWFGSIYVLF